MPPVNALSQPVSKRTGRDFGSLPVWTSVSVILAALVTGMIISTILSSVGWPFLICFILGALVATALVYIRGLFLTVASIPLLFGVGTFLASWLVSRLGAPDNSPLFSTTILLTSAYPLVEVFPYLAFALIACTLIAIFRLYRAKQSAQSISSKEQLSRHAIAESDERNRETTSRARKAAGKLTVSDLLERDKKPKASRFNAQRSVSTKPSGTESTHAKPSPRPTEASFIRRDAPSQARRVPRPAEPQRSWQRRDTMRSDPTRNSAVSRSARRITDAQLHQERGRRATPYDAHHPARNLDRTSDSERFLRRRPDPRRRAGESRNLPRESQQSETKRQQRPTRPRRPDTRNQGPRPLDDDIYGN